MTPPEWAPADQAALAQLQAGGNCAPFRKEYWRKDGSRVPVEIGAVLVSREPLRWACFIRDVSAEQQAEAAARRAAELASLAAALGQAATVGEVAQALGVRLRQAVDARVASIIEVRADQGVLRYVQMEGIPEEVVREWPEFSLSGDSPAVRAWRSREPVFYASPEAMDRDFPQLARSRAAAGTGSYLAVPLITGGQVTGLLVVTWAGPGELTAADMSFLVTVAGYAAQAMERARLFEAERAARAEADAARDEALTAARRVQALQEATAGLATAVTTDQIAQALVDKGLSVVGQQGAVALWTPGKDSLRMWLTASLGAETAARYVQTPAAEASQTMVGRAALTGQMIAVGSREEAMARFPPTAAVYRATGMQRAVAVPIRAGAEVIGALSFALPVRGQPTPQTIAVAEALAGLAGQALARARLYEAEYDAAHQLQRSLLPQLPAALAGVSIATCYRPAEQGHEVGGDWYDVFALPDGKIGCVAGDVVGHDLRAAVAMSRLQLLLRHAATAGAGPAGVLETLDAACPELTGTDFATIAYAEYDPAGQTLTYACGAHPPPLLADGATVTYLENGRSGPVGLGGPRSQATAKVPDGTRLVLYTDGLIEQRGEPIDIAFDQLAAAASRPVADIQAWCEGLVETMTAGHVLADDVAVACIGLNGPPPGPRSPAVLHRSLSDPGDLAPARQAIRDWAGSQQLTGPQETDLLIACGEALGNAIDHAYDGTEPGPVQLLLTRDPTRRIHVQVSDQGRWRTPALSPGNRGNGLTLIRQVAEQTSITTGPDGTTVTIILPGQQVPAPEPRQTGATP
jgi:GAF domain-containing protein